MSFIHKHKRTGQGCAVMGVWSPTCHFSTFWANVISEFGQLYAKKIGSFNECTGRNYPHKIRAAPSLIFPHMLMLVSLSAAHHLSNHVLITSINMNYYVQKETHKHWHANVSHDASSQLCNLWCFNCNFSALGNSAIRPFDLEMATKVTFAELSCVENWNFTCCSRVKN